MIRSWTIEIWPMTLGPKRWLLPPSLNSRLHWAARKRVGDQFKEQAFYLCKATKIPKLKSAVIEVTAYAIRPKDRDNLATSMKPIIDGIVSAGVVLDDSDLYVDLRFAKTIKVHHAINELTKIKVIEV